MNRKQKIIVSITGIVLVSLILIGLTYAYFLTKITGNTNEKSISVSTANLQIKYSDNSEEILGKDLVLEPSDNEIGSKTFTVTNEGNSETSYVVVIENVSITKSTDGTTTTFESNDFRYTLTCTKKDGTSCEQTNTKSVFPINGGILVGNSIEVDDVQTYTLKMWYIDTGKNQTNDMGKTLQAKINIKDITQVENPYSSNTNSLAYNIIENAKNKTNGTELVESPMTKPAEEISASWGTGKFVEHELDMSTQSSWYYGLTDKDAQPWNGGSSSGSVSECSDTIVGKYISYPTVSDSWYVKSCKSSTVAIVNGEELDYEQELSVTNDDYGMSYYYRGNVTNNYIDFAGMCWRIVRIAGDGSIKLILEDQDSACASSDGNWNIPTTTGGTNKDGYFGYTEHAANALIASDGTKNTSEIDIADYLNGKTKDTSSMAYAFKNFQTGPLKKNLDKLKSGDWCLNDKAYASSSDNTVPLTSTEILDRQIKGTSFYYDSYVRLKGKTKKEPTLKCNGTNMNKFSDAENTDMYVGTLTLDEIMYAGAIFGSKNMHYYLTNDYFNTSYGTYFLSLSLYSFEQSRDTQSFVQFNGSVSYNSVINSGYLRPSIILKTNIQITGGNGTKENPYVVQ